jgi:CRP/FNR family cyclic AMP-dependent transcriptional regulator
MNTQTPSALQDELLRAMAARGNLKRYPAQMVLIAEGDDADALFIVVSGRVKVYASSAAGKEVILATLGPGEYFGDMALDGGERSASVVTLEATSCVVVNGANLRAFLAEHPDFAQHLILKLIARVRALTASVKSLALEDVYGRVVKLLQTLSMPEGEVRALPHRLTQQDMAEYVGSSREMVSRILKELTIGGYVRSEGGRLLLLKTPPAAW